MVGGGDMGAGVVIVVMGARIESDLGEVGIYHSAWSKDCWGRIYMPSVIAGVRSPGHLDLHDHGQRRCLGERCD